ncbi:hypothetical protein Lser_V15G00360 [Lactuca serriola]
MQQRFILSYLRRPSRRGNHHCRRYHSFHEATTTASSVVASINWVRDRGLDHAVEKERDLKPMIEVKNLINSEPSKSLPLSIISDKRASLGIPIRSIDFIRKYPSVFQEFLPGGIGIHPHIKLTPEILTLDTEEQLLFESEIHKQDVADRLLKLLMIARINKIPLSVIDRLKWDLGLPNDYTQTIVPQFPDYFQVTSTGNELELVCWSDKLASSVMEKNSTSSFPLQYSRGFEVDKKFKKWVDDWQKLPYISPYENAFHLQAKSDESDKWTVAILHEVLHLLVPKKTDKDNLLFLGEYLGLRSRFKKALLQHPGIFYVSSKLHTHTVVLREAYKRDLLISKPQHPLMTLRSNYIHLMYTVKEQSKSKNQETGTKKQKARQVSNEEEEDDDDEDEDDEEDDTESEHEEDDETESLLSDSESEGATNIDSGNDRTPTKKQKFEGQVHLKDNKRHGNMDDDDDDDDGEEKDTKIRGRTSRTIKFNSESSSRRNTPNSRSSENDGRRRGRGRSRKNVFDEKKTDSGSFQMSDRRGGTRETSTRFLRTESPGARKSHARSSPRSNVSRTREKRI